MTAPVPQPRTYFQRIDEGFSDVDQKLKVLLSHRFDLLKERFTQASREEILELVQD